jgi:flavodoxin
MDAVIIYESLTGTTQRAARLIGDGFFDHQIGTQLFSLATVDPDAIAAADVVIVGTWTDGLLIVGQKPAKKKKIKQLPSLAGKPCFVFCTYAIHPGKTVEKLTKVLDELGGNVLGGLTIRRDHVAEDVAEFVAGAVPAIQALPPTPKPAPLPTRAATEDDDAPAEAEGAVAAEPTTADAGA